MEVNLFFCSSSWRRERAWLVGCVSERVYWTYFLSSSIVEEDFFTLRHAVLVVGLNE